MSRHSALRLPRVLCMALAGVSVLAAPAYAAWEPTKPVELVVPAGTGGGADQMARLLQGVITKNNLMKQPLIVVNKPGGAGAEGFLAVKDAKGDPNKLIITLSNLFTTPMATGVPFSWKDLTPVASWRSTSSSCGSTPTRPTSRQRTTCRRPRRATQPRSWAEPGPSRRTRSSPSQSRNRRA
jgi:tripartite-type tricarboxylate transporter receptor subunit TctC